MKINKENYQGFLLDYLDGELSEEETVVLFQFLEDHPALKTELEKLEKVRLPEPEEMIFPDKSKLYRLKEKPKEVFWLSWRKIAVAAVVTGLVFLAGYAWYVKSENLNTKKQVATSIIPPSKDSMASYKKDFASKRKPQPPSSSQKEILSEAATTKEEKTPNLSPSIEKETPNPVRKRVAESSEKLIKTRLEPIQKEEPVEHSGKIDFYPKVIIKPAEAKSVEKQLARQKTLPNQSKKNRSEGIQTKKRIVIQDADTTIGDKIYALQEKITHPLHTLKIKQIKIGTFSLQLN